jgi:hypothetical protein
VGRGGKESGRADGGGGEAKEGLGGSRRGGVWAVDQLEHRYAADLRSASTKFKVDMARVQKELAQLRGALQSRITCGEQRSAGLRA